MPRAAPIVGLVALLVAGEPVLSAAFVSPSPSSPRHQSAFGRGLDNAEIRSGNDSRRRHRALLSLHAPRKTSATTPLTRLFMDLEPLASEGDWSAYLDDETTGLVYYFNDKTGESLWEAPTDTFPPLEMSRTQEEATKEKRAEYEESLAPQEESAETKSSVGGFFSSLLGGSKQGVSEIEEQDAVVEEEETIAEEVMTASRGFASFFSSPEIEEQDAVVEEEETIAEEVMTAPRGFASFFARSKETATSSAGIIEESELDDGAYAGSYQGTEETATKKKAATKTKGTTPVAEEVAVTTAPAPAPAPAKKKIAFGNIFQKSKEENIIIPSDTPIKLEVSSKVLPSPEKVSWGGEDAVFTKGRSFGVFDGVSGAEKVKGVALYSFTLASQVKNLIGDEGLTISEMTDALATATDIANMEATGASTATVASIGEDDILRVLNVGDCTVLVYRDGKVTAKTKAIQHYFDCPYQLAEDSPDRAKDGSKLTFAVQAGDVIVAGSDGIFDNLTEAQVWEEICSVPPRAGMIAGKIINQSRAVSLDEEAPTPYARQAQKNRYEKYKTGLGGKVDDISCVVVRCL